MAEELADCKGLIYDAELIQTNIFRFVIDQQHLKKLKLDHSGVRTKLREEYNILCNAGQNDFIRFVTHRSVD